ncbi:MAG: hypothetical protein ACSHXD_20125 [Marinosulfonomonas sp.]
MFYATAQSWLAFQQQTGMPMGSHAQEMLLNATLSAFAFLWASRWKTSVTSELSNQKQNIESSNPSGSSSQQTENESGQIAVPAEKEILDAPGFGDSERSRHGKIVDAEWTEVHAGTSNWKWLTFLFAGLFLLTLVLVAVQPNLFRNESTAIEPREIVTGQRENAATVVSPSDTAEPAGSDPNSTGTTSTLLRLPDDFVECSSEGGLSLCYPSSFIIQLDRQLVQQSGSGEFEVAGQLYPYRVEWHTTGVIDGRTPYTIHLDAMWRGLWVKELFQGYEAWSMGFQSSISAVTTEVQAVGGRPLRDGEYGCGISITARDELINLGSGC